MVILAASFLAFLFYALRTLTPAFRFLPYMMGLLILSVILQDYQESHPSMGRKKKKSKKPKKLTAKEIMLREEKQKREAIRQKELDEMFDDA
jgi:hypothetical protein